ncbi:MAG: intermembrane transport protein PqiB, partial [Myxococcota bacterium]
MSDEQADVTQRRTISRIWVLPIVALILGAWMVWFTLESQGPEITIHFGTAEGIEAGKTKIRARSVVVGLVTSVGLTDDLEHVVVVADMEKFAEKLLREDSEFWVVRPRIGAGGITGLGTIVSGGYIELAPGSGENGQRHFEGRDDLPVTPVGAPGLRLTLVSDRAGSLGPGDPILYRGFRVGRVESADFDVETREARYDAFIDQPYDTLVTTGTRFWNASGVNFSATAEGVELSTGSLQSLLIGGVTFGVIDEANPGEPAADDAEFTLYENEPKIHETEYRESIEYVLEFSRSIRGLKPGAPVEYRGLRAGTVDRVLLEEFVEGDSGDGASIPVLIRLEPARLAFGDDAAGRERMLRGIESGVSQGLRASLATGNLLTGSLFVALDTYPDVPADEVREFAGRPTIPTIGSGLEGLQQQAIVFLKNPNPLPVEDLVGSADATLQELNATVATLHTVLRSDGIQSLPDQLELTLAELDRTLRKVSELAASLEAQPSS